MSQKIMPDRVASSILSSTGNLEPEDDTLCQNPVRCLFTLSVTNPMLSVSR